MSAELRSHLPIRLDSHHLPILDDDFLDGFVQHVRPAVDGTQPGIRHNTQAGGDFRLLTTLFTFLKMYFNWKSSQKSHHHIHNQTRHTEGEKRFLPSKPLRKFSQAVHGVEVWALAISGQRFAVKLYSVYRVNARLVEVTEKTQKKRFIVKALQSS